VDDRLSRLLEVAYRTVPAAEANRAISEAREEAATSGAAFARPARDAGGEFPLARSYELVIDPEGQWDGFAAEALPRLVYHLESVGAHPPLCKGMVVAAFVGDRLHFLRAGEMIGRAAELSGISVDELFRRHGTGESRTSVEAPPLALPPDAGKR
jgi:GNAT superfamily N-acetyltransferase